jgi:hypothetical protein
MPPDQRDPDNLLGGCGGGCVWLIACGFLGFGLWFAPGWANGWPFGLHRNVVWPLGLAVLVFGAVLGAIVGVGPPRPEETETAPSPSSRIDRIGGVIVAGVAAVIAFVAFRSQAVAIWP